MSDVWTDRLSEYLDDELPPGERAALEGHLAQCAECSATLADLRRVVAVDFLHRPAEGLPLGHERLEVEDLRGEVVELDLVVVDDHREVVQRVSRLAELGATVSSRAGLVRIAFHIWNTPQDVDLAAAALNSVRSRP